jgi:C_GCAxxG_C_C family probable redox protein
MMEFQWSERLSMQTTDVAEARFQEGYSCSQAVFSALAVRWGVGPEISLRIAAGFGGGIARSGGTCGCVTGGIMALGLTQSGVDPEANRASKDKTTDVCRQFLRVFEEHNGSTRCAGLLQCDISTPEGLAVHRTGVHRPLCARFVRDAVEIVESMLAPASTAQAPGRP